MKQRAKQARVKALRRECRPLGQQADGIVRMQTFLMAGQHPEIADPRILLQLLAKQPGRILDKDRVGGVQLGKGLFILAFDHDLRFGRHGGAGMSIKSSNHNTPVRGVTSTDRRATDR